MEANRDSVYLRLFSDDMTRALKRRKADVPLVVGNPPFSFRRVRLFGVVVDVTPRSEKSCWLSVDDATGPQFFFFFVFFFLLNNACGGCSIWRS
jgi:hypothetical protein